MKSVLKVAKTIGIVILAMFVGNIVMMGLLQLGHSLFGSLEGFDPTAPYAERAAAVSIYLQDHTLAVYWIFFEHGAGAFLGVLIATYLSKPRRVFRSGYEQRSISASLIVALLYVLGTITNDLVTVPMGLSWSLIDLSVVLLLSLCAFWLAGGFKKQSPSESVSSAEETYRG